MDNILYGYWIRDNHVWIVDLCGTRQLFIMDNGFSWTMYFLNILLIGKEKLVNDYNSIVANECFENLSSNESS